MSKARSAICAKARYPVGFVFGAGHKKEGSISEEFLRKRKAMQKKRGPIKVKLNGHRSALNA